MATTGRHPIVTEGFSVGFLPGNREDSTYQLTDEHRNVDLPFGFMDHDYENPDIYRFLDRFHEREPTVAVVGDAYSRQEAEQYQAVIDDLTETYPDRRFIVAPKCDAAFDVLDSVTVTLGYANGTSKIQGADLGSAKFRGWDVHILGGNPEDAYEAIQTLTQPTLDGRPSANVVGYDTNLPMRMAYWEYWTPQEWRDNGHLSPRESARRSYREIKQSLQDRGVWPESTPIETYGPAVREPDDPVYATGDDIRSQTALEHAIVEDYTDCITRAYLSETEQAFVEYRDGLRRTGD